MLKLKKIIPAPKGYGSVRTTAGYHDTKYKLHSLFLLHQTLCTPFHNIREETYVYIHRTHWGVRLTTVAIQTQPIQSLCIVVDLKVDVEIAVALLVMELS